WESRAHNFCKRRQRQPNSGLSPVLDHQPGYATEIAEVPRHERCSRLEDDGCDAQIHCPDVEPKRPQSLEPADGGLSIQEDLNLRAKLHRFGQFAVGHLELLRGTSSPDEGIPPCQLFFNRDDTRRQLGGRMCLDTPVDLVVPFPKKGEGVGVKYVESHAVTVSRGRSRPPGDTRPSLASTPPGAGVLSASRQTSSTGVQ